MKYTINDLVKVGQKFLNESEEMETGNSDRNAAIANRKSRLGMFLINVDQPFGSDLSTLSNDDAKYIMYHLRQMKQQEQQ